MSRYNEAFKGFATAVLLIMLGAFIGHMATLRYWITPMKQRIEEVSRFADALEENQDLKTREEMYKKMLDKITNKENAGRMEKVLEKLLEEDKKTKDIPILEFQKPTFVNPSNPYYHKTNDK